MVHCSECWLLIGREVPLKFFKGGTLTILKTCGSVIPPGECLESVQMGPFRDTVRLSDPAPWNSDSVIPPGECLESVQMGPFRDIVRLSDPAPWNSD